MEQFNSFINSINDYTELFDNYSQKFLNEIENNIFWIKSFEFYSKESNNKKAKTFCDEIKLKYKEYYRKTSFIYNNKYIEKIIKLNEKINNILNDMSDFNPPRINSLNDSSININIENSINSEKSFLKEMNESELKNYSNFYNYENEQNNENNGKNISEKSNSIILNCSFHENNKIKGFEFFNKKNIEKILKIIKNGNEKDILLYLNQEKNKSNFLNSIGIFIKGFINRCNYIFNNDILNVSKSLSDKKNEDIILKEKFKYPFISNENNFDCYIQYLKDINEMCVHEFNNNIFNNSFCISEINNMIIDSIRPIFNDDKLKLIDNEYNIFSEESDEAETILYQNTKRFIIPLIGNIGPGKSACINMIVQNDYSIKIKYKKEIEKKNILYVYNKPDKNIYERPFNNLSELKKKNKLENYLNFNRIKNFKREKKKFRK